MLVLNDKTWLTTDFTSFHVFQPFVAGYQSGLVVLGPSTQEESGTISVVDPIELPFHCFQRIVEALRQVDGMTFTDSKGTHIDTQPTWDVTLEITPTCFFKLSKKNNRGAEYIVKVIKKQQFLKISEALSKVFFLAMPEPLQSIKELAEYTIRKGHHMTEKDRQTFFDELGTFDSETLLECVDQVDNIAKTPDIYVKVRDFYYVHHETLRSFCHWRCFHRGQPSQLQTEAPPPPTPPPPPPTPPPAPQQTQ